MKLQVWDSTGNVCNQTDSSPSRKHSRRMLRAEQKTNAIRKRVDKQNLICVFRLELRKIDTIIIIFMYFSASNVNMLQT